MIYVWAILALVVLVVIHELGHFLAAKAVGIRATKFYVFFPPAVFKKQVGEVEYGIGAIPAGGFVKLPGMFKPVGKDVSERLIWLFERDKLEHLDHFAARIDGCDDPDEIGMVLRQLKTELPSGDNKSIVKLHKRVDDMIDDCHPKAYWRSDLWRRMVVIFAGPLVNILVAFVVLTGFFWLGQPTYQITSGIQVGSIVEDSPADRAGITKDSTVTYWGGTFVDQPVTDVENLVNEARGEPVEVGWVDASGDEQRQVLVPQKLDDDSGVTDPRVGVNFGQFNIEVIGREVTSLGVGTKAALISMRDITWGNVSAIPRIAFQKEVRDQVGSAVGIVQFSSDVRDAGREWQYFGIISLILAVMNLLPLLPLDGGHLTFGLLEFLRKGRPMPRIAFERYSVFGLALMLLLFSIGLNNDLTR